jgi:hypothetical protein
MSRSKDHLDLEQRRALFSVSAASMLDGRCSIEEIFEKGRALGLDDSFLERTVINLARGRLQAIRAKERGESE